MSAAIQIDASSRDPVAQLIIGETAAIRGLRALIRVAASTRLPVLIEGPTGSGKELVAAAMHAVSGRVGAFVPFNVCAIADSMFEDALFGHVRGAFTGALFDADGYLREANGGTAFFDEVSGLSLALQVKLLRAIETGRFRPVGARADVSSEFRVIAATNQRLDVLVEGGAFRMDLAHRLSGVMLAVPPLAERADDVPLLVRHFLATDGRREVSLDPAGLDLLCRHDWPGNVRELRHVVEWACALGGGRLSHDVVATALSRRRSPDAATTAVIRADIRDALERHDWDTTAAARSLGIHRGTLYRKIKRLGLAPPNVRSSPA